MSLLAVSLPCVRFAAERTEHLAEHRLGFGDQRVIGRQALPTQLKPAIE